jgi:hypothetical protein
LQGTATGGATDKNSIQGEVGGSSSNASDRSIIVVGGKSSDTYFQSIDDLWHQFQQDPDSQTTQLFGNQLGAVVDMVTTVDQNRGTPKGSCF